MVPLGCSLLTSTVRCRVTGATVAGLRDVLQRHSGSSNFDSCPLEVTSRGYLPVMVMEHGTRAGYQASLTARRGKGKVLVHVAYQRRGGGHGEAAEERWCCWT